jgi:HK97 gp10 family phage protein
VSAGIETNLTVWRGNEVKRKADVGLAASLFTIGLVVEGQAKLLCPVDQGRLRGSITVQSDVDGTNVSGAARASDKINSPREELVVHVGTAVEYGPYVEFGTVRSSAQPFLRPALDNARGRSQRIAITGIRRDFGDLIE